MGGEGDPPESGRRGADGAKSPQGEGHEGSLALFLGTFRNPRLRNVVLAYGTAISGGTAFVSLLLVLTYQRIGPAGPGLVILVRSIVGALASPGVAVLSERWRRERVLALGYGVRAVAGLVGLVVFAGHGPAGFLYAAAALEGAGAAAPYSIQYAILPWLADSPAQLVAANALSSMQEVGGIVVGGVLDVILLKWSGPSAIFVAVTVLWVGGSLLVLSIRGVNTRLQAGAEAAGPASFLRRLLAGVSYLRRSRGPRDVVLAFALPVLLAGMAQAFASSLSTSLLHLGPSGTPLLVSAVGVGGLLGGVFSLSFAHRQRLTPYLAAGLLLSAIGPVIVAGAPYLAVTLLVLAGFGVGIAMQTVATHSLLQRTVPTASLGAVVGVTGLMNFVATGVSGIVAAGLDAWLGIRITLLFTGILALAATGLVILRLPEVDRTDLAGAEQRKVIEMPELFRPLPVAVRSHLARELVPVAVASGEPVIRQGERGDDFFIVESGAFDVLTDGKAVGSLGEGDTFGEIALLFDSPRTATVRAEQDSKVWRLDRESFLAALTGNPECEALARAVAKERSPTIEPED